MNNCVKYLLLAAMLLAVADDARAQLPISLSVKGGIAVPVHNDADILKPGLHLGAGLKLPLLPLQIDASYDRMSGQNDLPDISILGGGVSFPITVTPPLLPISVYVLGGGGLYRSDSGATSTDFGANAGAGVRLGIPGLRLFGEGRGNILFNENNRITYGTVGIGLRF